METTRLERFKEAIRRLKKDDIIDSQAQIANDLGYKRAQTISDFVTGTTPLTNKFLKAFCSKYGISEDFINGISSYSEMYLPVKQNQGLGDSISTKLDTDTEGAIRDLQGILGINRNSRKRQLFEELRKEIHNEYRQKIENKTPYYELFGDLDLRVFILESLKSK